ncbi:hypothetical protein, partial [Methanopyrus kandleri]
MRVHDRNGTYEARFKAEVVKKLPVNSLAALLALSCLAVTPFAASIPLSLSPTELSVHVNVGSRVPYGSEAWARVVLETPEGRFEYDTRERTGGNLVLPPEPFRVRVELYDGKELRASYEYEIRPERAVVNPFGPRYVEFEIVPRSVPQSPDARVWGWRVLHPSVEAPETHLESTFLLETPTGTAAFILRLDIAGDVPLLLPRPDDLTSLLTALSTSCLARELNTMLGLPDDVLYRPLTVPRLPPEYALVGLTACLTTLTARHYLGLVTLPTLGVFVNDGGFAILPLGLWGARLIAAGTGLPLPLVGALMRLVQWAFDERELSADVKYYWELPRLVLTTPPTWYLERALKDPARLIFVYLLPGVVIASLPLPLALLLYYLCELSEEPGLLGVLDAPVRLLLEWGLPTGLTHVLLLLLPALALYTPPPEPLEALLALPSSLAHLTTLLLTPPLLLLPQKLETEFEVSVNVDASPPQ